MRPAAQDSAGAGFRDARLDEVLVVRRGRGQGQAIGRGKLNPSAAGHVESGQSYIDAAFQELGEELFRSGMPGIMICACQRYPNDTAETAPEMSQLFYVVHPGPFSPDPDEAYEIWWERTEEVYACMRARPGSYSGAFVNAMERFMELRRITGSQRI